MTIFGFNTDVRHGDTVYHVQSEARVSDLLVQTLVFVKGLCVGKRTTSYAQEAASPEFSEEAIHQLLKAQHRTVTEAIQAGNMKSAMGTVGEVQDFGGSGLSLTWIKAGAIGTQDHILLNFQVADAGKPVGGAEVIARVGSDAGAPEIARAISDNSGKIEMKIAITDDLRRESAITVQATSGNKSATRKFRLKAKEQS